VALVLTWVAGPDAGGRAIVGPGRHFVGRATGCALGADDPHLAAHHAMVEVAADGRWQWHPLVLARAGEPATEPPWLACGSGLVELGSADPGRERGLPRPAGVVVRTPRATPSAPDLQVAVDRAAIRESLPTGPGWMGAVPSLLGLVAAVVLAAIARQAMFAVFGAIGAAVGLGAWAVTTWSDRRAHRRAAAIDRSTIARHAAATAAARAQAVRHHRQATATLTDALDAIHRHDGPLWQRRATDPDRLTVAIGVGEVPWPSPLQATSIDEPAGFDGTVTLDLAAARCVAVRGHTPATDAVLRAWLVQWMAHLGPADLRVLVVTERSDAWSWVVDAPHVSLTDARSVLSTADAVWADAATTTQLVVVTDDPHPLAVRTSPVRRLYERERAPMVVVQVSNDEAVPQVCRAELTVSSSGRGRWVPDTSVSGLPVPVHTAGLGLRAATRAVTVLAGCVDPEAGADGGALPTVVRLDDLITIDPPSITRRWADAGADPRPCAVLGVAAGAHGCEPVPLDLAADGPHVLVAGTTGAGKSELLRSLVVSLAAAVPPTALHLVLIDFKGGAAFDAVAALPHVAGVVTDLDGHSVQRCLLALDAELRRREHVLRASGSSDLTAHRAAGGPATPRLLVVVDEFATLARNHPEQLRTLLGIAQRGRSLGVHLVLATQRPAGVVTDDVRANTAARLSLRVHDTADALDVVGDVAPAGFPRAAPGRAMLRLGDDRVVLHTAYCADIAVAVSAVNEAAATIDLPAATPLWMDALPEHLALADVDPPALGIVDDPTNRRRLPLQHHHRDGLAVVGARAHTAMAVATIVTVARAGGREVYVLGAAGELGRRGVTVVGLDDTERRLRLLERCERADRRALVVVDGVAALRRALDDDHFDEYERWGAVVRGGAVDAVVVADHPADVPLTWLAACHHRWVFALADPADGATLGVPADAMPPPMAGRCAVVGPGGTVLSAQVADASCAPPGLHAHPTPGVDVLPPRIDRHDLGDDRQAIGRRADTLDDAFLAIEPGCGALVLGPPRSGRSTALAALLHAWEHQHPDSGLVVLCPRRTTLSHPALTREVDDALQAAIELLERGPLLFVVDDADVVDDPRLTELCSRPEVTVVASATPEGLRHQHGSWTTALRRLRVGVAMVGCDRLDGDLLGVTLPRRPPIATRPGLVWLVDHGEVTLTQLVVPTPPADADARRPTLTLAASGAGR
jgi:S-DNA-T family DNA segregation ATPase FtsK/SpoIIIE